MRLVDLTGAELGNVLEAARGCGRYPRLRFILVADHGAAMIRGAYEPRLVSHHGPKGSRATLAAAPRRGAGGAVARAGWHQTSHVAPLAYRPQAPTGRDEPVAPPKTLTPYSSGLPSGPLAGCRPEQRPRGSGPQRLAQ